MKLKCKICDKEFEYPRFKNTCSKSCSVKLGHLTSGSRSESIKKGLEKVDKIKLKKNISKSIKKWHKQMSEEQKEQLNKNHKIAGLKLASDPYWRIKVGKGTSNGISKMSLKDKKSLSEKRRKNFLSKECQIKLYNTKKLNGTFKISKPEKEIYKILYIKYPDLIYQYRSEKYPFNCDFYIPSLDLYIEYQGNWTHGFKPYNPEDKECIEKLKLWNSKIKENKKYYSQAKYVWTNLDPRKRKIAKENNLNWIEFFSMEEFYQWYNEE